MFKGVAEKFVPMPDELANIRYWPGLDGTLYLSANFWKPAQQRLVIVRILLISIVGHNNVCFLGRSAVSPKLCLSSLQRRNLGSLCISCNCIETGKQSAALHQACMLLLLRMHAPSYLPQWHHYWRQGLCCLSRPETEKGLSAKFERQHQKTCSSESFLAQ